MIMDTSYLRYTGELRSYCCVHILVADESDSSDKPRKRARSNFTKDQIDVLRAHFKANPNPTSADLESLSELTGHSYKVIQVG